MAIIKCKMCGGDLMLTEGSTVAECEYCGTRQTVPVADNEKKLIQFERAERLRRNCEFDKAAGLYEAIVSEFRQEAEAYWGLVLCKYGIEYVDDPATGRKIPTCHRSSFDSVLEDSNFDQAMENADEEALRVYRQEAKQIENIRRGILEVSSSEKPYDIFICYKETDSKGNRTVDSLLAQDIYDALTAKGYRVFFSRISLEDKLGQAYEPYIFAALNSAKIMLAVGTCYEHYNAVWVKNEWSRYLKIIAQDKGKYLIPCYKNIDAYDIPKEFAHLQGQDMGKVGAIADLLRGIEKLMPREEKSVISIAEHGTITPLLKRANMFLEDGIWNSADEYFEKVLNIDPENAHSYLGKLLAEYKIRKAEDLGTCTVNFTTSYNYQKAWQFGDDGIRKILDAVPKKELFQSDGEHRLRTKKNMVRIATVVAVLVVVMVTWMSWKKESSDYEKSLNDITNLGNDKVSEETILDNKIGLSENQEEQELQKLESAYQAAFAWMNAREYGKAAIAFAKLEGYKDARNRSFEMWRYVPGRKTISLWWDDVLALSTDRTVMVDRFRFDEMMSGNVLDSYFTEYKDIVSLHGFIGLKYDGTLVLPDERKLDNRESYREQFAEVNAYNAFIDIQKQYGEILQNWENIVTLDECTTSFGFFAAIGITENGDILSVGLDDQIKEVVEEWSDIIDVDISHSYVVGLKSDGTVVAAGNNDFGQCDVKDWADIVAITIDSGGGETTLGLKSDGTVVAVGSNITGVLQNVKTWKDIAVLDEACGIKHDGTVVEPSHASLAGSPDIGKWKNVVSIAANDQHTVALRTDGTLLFSDVDYNGFSKAAHWQAIQVP